jgi:hypothetical protein
MPVAVKTIFQLYMTGSFKEMALMCHFFIRHQSGARLSQPFVVYFMVQCQHLLFGAEEEHEKHCPGWLSQ